MRAVPTSLATLVVLAALAGEARAAGAPIPPSPTRWVTDGVGFLSPSARAELDAQLERYQEDSGHQVVVWIGDTLAGAPLDDWAVHTFEAWRVGRKGLDDGIAMFVFATDRTIDIEVGYGLEDRVPDAIAHRVIEEVMAPRLRAGDRDGAVRAGVAAILQAIEGHAVAGGQSAAPRSRPGIGQIVPGALVAIAFVLLLIFNPRLALMLLWTIGTGGRGGRGSGGFSGGGGRSGGGGSRGSW